MYVYDDNYFNKKKKIIKNQLLNEDNSVFSFNIMKCFVNYFHCFN